MKNVENEKLDLKTILVYCIFENYQNYYFVKLDSIDTSRKMKWRVADVVVLLIQFVKNQT